MSSDFLKSEEVEPIVNQLEDFPEKKKFNTDAPGQKIVKKQDDIDAHRNPTKTEDADDKKSKDDNIPEQNQPSPGQVNQNAQKLGSTSGKEEDVEKEWVFLDTVPDFMNCRICGGVFKLPQLLSCCGTKICKKCMARHLQRRAIVNQQPSCPFCLSTEFELVDNKALEDSINQLRVKCCYQHKGCGWTGTLQNGKLHLNECDFVPMNCPNGCGYEQFERYKFSDHMRICPHTHTTCLFGTIGCNMKVPQVRPAAQKHKNDCLSEHLLLVARKNTELLKDFRHHCALLSSEDCKPKLSNGEHAKSQKEALSSIQHTIATLKESLQDIKKRTSSLKAELREKEICLEHIKVRILKTNEVEAAYKERIANLQTCPVPDAAGISYPPVIFTIDNFKKRIKLKDNMWLSPPFYTHVGGYKMCLSVYPAGSRRSGNESYMSVYIHFLAGEFDEHLIWPFPGAIFTITAINQCADQCNKSVNLELDGKDTLLIRSQLTDQYRCLSFEFGASDFLSHSNLSSFLTRDNCFKLMLYRIQFLKI